MVATISVGLGIGTLPPALVTAAGAAALGCICGLYLGRLAAGGARAVVGLRTMVLGTLVTGACLLGAREPEVGRHPPTESPAYSVIRLRLGEGSARVVGFSHPPCLRTRAEPASKPPVSRRRQALWSLGAGLGACAVGLFWGRWLEGHRGGPGTPTSTRRTNKRDADQEP